MRQEGWEENKLFKTQTHHNVNPKY